MLLAYIYKLIISFILTLFSSHNVATSHPVHISAYMSSKRRVVSSNTSIPTRGTMPKHGHCELDSHADTIVAGSNCTLISRTGKECDVSPYREDYTPITNVPIVTAATAWQSPDTGQTYILILNECLWMGDTMSHTLINPNQLRHFGTLVNDNPMSSTPLSIITEDKEFAMPLDMKGTIVYANTYAPSDYELNTYPHIVLSSPHVWDPTMVKFPRCPHTLEDYLSDDRKLCSLSTYDVHSYALDEDPLDHNPAIFYEKANMRNAGSQT